MKKDAKIFGWICVAVSALFLIGALTIVPFEELSPVSPGGYPIFIAILCLIFSVILMVTGKHKAVETKPLFSPVIVAFMIMLVLYVLGIIYLHYTIATLLFLFAAIFYLRRDSWKQAILVAYISTFMILLIFQYFFNVLLP